MTGTAISVDILVVLACVMLAHIRFADLASNEDLLQITLQGCKYTASLVKSGQGRVVVQQWFARKGGGILETKTDYHVSFSGAKFRLSESEEVVRNDPGEPACPTARAVEAGTVLQREVAYDGEGIIEYRPASKAATKGDSKSAWGRQYLGAYRTRLAVPGHGILDPQSFIAQHELAIRTEPRIAGSETIDGDECTIVEIADRIPVDSAADVVDTYWLWINPSKGYTVPRIRGWSEGGTSAKKWLCGEADTEVREYAGGIWGPDRVVWQDYAIRPDTGEQYTKSRHAITYDAGFKLNPPVTQSDLLLVLPPGTEVYDEILDARYTVP